LIDSKSRPVNIHPETFCTQSLSNQTGDEGMQQNKKSKIVMASMLVDDVRNDSRFFAVPDEASDLETIRNTVLQAYACASGILEGTIDNQKLILQWAPDSVHDGAELIQQEAVVLAKQKKYERAAEKWKHALSLNPDDIEYAYKLGLVFFEIRRYAEAIQYLENVVRICPIHEKAQLLLGLCYNKMKKYNLAEKYILESNRLNRSNIFSYLNLGAIYSVQHKFNDAVEMFNQVIHLSPSEPKGYLGLARTFAMLNDHEAANRNYQKVIELAPESSMAEYAKRSMHHPEKEEPQNIVEAKREEHLAKGIGFSLAGDYPKAIEQYQLFLKAQPSDDYAWYLLGEARIRTGQIAEAADCLKRAIKINGKRGLYYKTLGIALHYFGKPAEVVEIIKHAMELGKKDPLSHTLLGISLLKLRRAEDGIRELQSALKKDPHNLLALYQMAVAKLQTQNKAEAAMILEKLTRIEYFAPVKDNAVKLLKTIKMNQ
jgi:tetratricopeptide (TPR) repeat protein